MFVALSALEWLGEAGFAWLVTCHKLASRIEIHYGRTESERSALTVISHENVRTS